MRLPGAVCKRGWDDMMVWGRDARGVWLRETMGAKRAAEQLVWWGRWKVGFYQCSGKFFRTVTLGIA